MTDEQEKLKESFEIITNIYKSGNYSLAETKTNSLIKKYNNVPVLYNLLGMTLNAQKKTEEAIKSYEKALVLNPRFAIAYNNLGNIYFNNQKNIIKAKELYEKAIQLAPNFALAYNNLGNLFRESNNFSEAINNFKKAIEYDSKNFVIYSNLGTAYENLGEFSKAKEFFEKAIEINPNFMLAHRNLSTLIKYSEENSHLKQMKEINLNKNISEEKKADLYMALGKAHEDLKDYRNSFNFYISGNKIKRKTINYKVESDVELFNKIKKAFNKDFFKNINITNNKDSTPIYIIGMPRSGTTLVEQILSSHPDVYGAGELLELGNQIRKYFINNNKLSFPEKISDWNMESINEIGKNYLTYIRNISQNSKHITDKLPHNFQWLGFIKIIFPNAKIIHCKRNKYDNCLSIFKNFFAGGLNFSYDLKEIGLHYKEYNRLMNHWLELMPDFIHEIKYEEIVADSENKIKDLLKFCNLNWHPDCLEFYKNKRPVLTASMAQVKKPIYKDSVKAWEKFKFGLKPLIDELDKI